MRANTYTPRGSKITLNTIAYWCVGWSARLPSLGYGSNRSLFCVCVFLVCFQMCVLYICCARRSCVSFVVQLCCCMDVCFCVSLLLVFCVLVLFCFRSASLVSTASLAPHCSAACRPCLFCLWLAVVRVVCLCFSLCFPLSVRLPQMPILPLAP